MAYSRWTYSDWYVYKNASNGKLVCYHNSGLVANYEFNRNVDYFIRKNFPKIPKSDKVELKFIIDVANADYNDERNENEQKD